MTPTPASLALVVCTYNRAADLDRVLGFIGDQHAPGVRWSVLVVDNNSTDGTAAVVAAHAAAGRVPGLRRVVETTQGLTPARRRGVSETDADWVAFVDDDNLLRPDWVAEVAAAVREHPSAGAVGGRVLPSWAEPPPPYLPSFGWALAMQDHGPSPREVDGLVGAGLVVRRAALEATGWLDRPLLADRVGTRLVSGGDVEIGQRLRAAGFPLRYHPACVLDHRVPPERTGRPYVLRLLSGLGASHALTSALTWPGSEPAWRRHAWAECRRHAGWAARELAAALRRTPGHGVTPALAWASFAWGIARGTRSVRQMDAADRAALLGAAAGPLPEAT